MISTTVLVLAEDFDDEQTAQTVAEAIARGLSADGRFRCDTCPIQAGGTGSRSLHGARAGFRSNPSSALLDLHDFDRRMSAVRAIVIATPRLDDRALAGSFAFEAATRARQAGVPAYAVTAENALDSFEARIVDLQAILRASTVRALTVAGRKLATLM